MSPEFLSREQAAAFLNISPRTLQRYTKRRIITYVRIGRRVLYRREWLNAFMESQTVRCQQTNSSPSPDTNPQR